MIRKLLTLAIIPVILLVVGRAAESLTLYSWDQFVKYQSPYLAPLPHGQPADRLASQTVVVVVDGLRLDTSRTLGTLNKLRQRGADLIALTGEPSLSLPTWTVIASGADQEVSGVTTNWYEGAAKVDSIFAEAKRQGLTTAVVGGGSWSKLFGSWIDYAETLEEPEKYGDVAAIQAVDAQVVERAGNLLHDRRPNLAVIHLMGPDYVGHSFGGASRQYREEASVLDGQLATLVQGIDLGQTTLIVTADHGQLDGGGHGGWERVVKETPLVLAGRGIKSGGSIRPVGQGDIAPTVSVILGAPVPVHNQGRALLEILDETAAAKGQQGLVVARQLALFYDAYVDHLGSKAFAQSRLASSQAAIASGDPAALADFRGQLKQEQLTIREGKFASERLIRLIVALVVVLVPLIHVARTRPLKNLLAPLGGAAIYFTLYNLLFFARGYQWSLSTFNFEQQMAGFFKQRGIEALVMTLIAVIVVAVAYRRRSIWDTAWSAVNTSFLIAYLLVVQIAVFFVLYGFSFPWYLPDLRIGIKAYFDLLQLVSVTWPMTYLPLALLLPLVAIGVRPLAKRAEGRWTGEKRALPTVEIKS